MFELIAFLCVLAVVGGVMSAMTALKMIAWAFILPFVIVAVMWMLSR